MSWENEPPVERLGKVERTGRCEVCLEPATSVCVAMSLSGNECVRRRCDEHICMCGDGEKMSIEAYLARSN